MRTFRIALPGKSVRRGKVDEVVLDSRFPSPKVDTAANPAHAGIIFVDWSSSITVPINTAKIIDSFPHNYGYIPSVLASYKFDNGATVLKGTLPFGYGALGVIFIDADEENINLKFFSLDDSVPVPAFTLQARYYVMSEHGL